MRNRGGDRRDIGEGNLIPWEPCGAQRRLPVIGAIIEGVAKRRDADGRRDLHPERIEGAIALESRLLLLSCPTVRERVVEEVILRGERCWLGWISWLNRRVARDVELLGFLRRENTVPRHDRGDLGVRARIGGAVVNADGEWISTVRRIGPFRADRIRSSKNPINVDPGVRVNHLTGLVPEHDVEVPGIERRSSGYIHPGYTSGGRGIKIDTSRSCVNLDDPAVIWCKRSEGRSSIGLGNDGLVRR